MRTQLRVLERKGHVRHEENGAKFIYMPAVPRRSARKSALRHLVDTFFDGSVEKGRRRAPRRRGRARERRGARAHRRAGGEGAHRQAGRCEMMILLGSTLKVSALILAGLAGAAAARRHSAAARHWVIAASLLCALAIPVLERYVPSWTIPTTSTQFSTSVMARPLSTGAVVSRPRASRIQRGCRRRLRAVIEDSRSHRVVVVGAVDSHSASWC